MPKHEKIDGEKLYSILKPIMYDKNFNLSSLSEDLGYSKSYLSNCIRQNSTSTTTMGLLDAKYGIKKSTYIVEEEKKESEVNNITTDLVYESVKNGIIDGFDEIKDELRKIIHDEVCSAVKEVLEE